MEQFELNTDYIELCQLLKLCGPKVTGGQAKLLISEGQVNVDGQIELRKKCKIRPGQTVTFEAFVIRVISASR